MYHLLAVEKITETEEDRKMLTLKKVVLVTRDVRFFEKVNFEAIQRINNLSQVEEIWSYNKTPIILEEFYNEDISNQKYPALHVPSELRDINDFITFCHGNGIECGEICEGQRFDTTQDDCFLCYIGSHNGTVSEFNKETQRFSDIIIYESENFFVKIELGCLIPGMVMINPKKHHYSMARLPEEQFKEYYEVMEDIELLLKVTYGRDLTVIFFEHGSSPTGFSSHAKSIVHAHTHVAIGCEFEEKFLEMVKLKPVEHERTLFRDKYLSYQAGTSGQLMAVTDPRVYVPRQFPRQVIAYKNGIPNEFSNWRIEPFYGNIKSTFVDIWEALTKNKNDFSQRVLERTQGFQDSLPIVRENWEN